MAAVGFAPIWVLPDAPTLQFGVPAAWASPGFQFSAGPHLQTYSFCKSQPIQTAIGLRAMLVFHRAQRSPVPAVSQP